MRPLLVPCISVLSSPVGLSVSHLRLSLQVPAGRHGYCVLEQRPDGLPRCLAGDPEARPHPAAAHRRALPPWTSLPSGTGVPRPDPSPASPEMRQVQPSPARLQPESKTPPASPIASLNT